MKTFYSVVALLAAMSSAEIIYDERLPDPYCCILYAAKDWAIDTENNESSASN